MQIKFTTLTAVVEYFTIFHTFWGALDGLYSQISLTDSVAVGISTGLILCAHFHHYILFILCINSCNLFICSED